MEKPPRRDSDSPHSPSDDEKKVGADPASLEKHAYGELPLDPDESLSEDEKAKVVWISATKEHQCAEQKINQPI